MRWRTRTATGLLLGVAAGALVDAAFGGNLVGGAVLTVLTVVASYLVGAWLSPALAGVTSLAAVTLLTAANQMADQGRYTAANDFFFFAVLIGGVALVGNLVSARAAQVRELRALSVIRAEQRSRELEAARLEERTRLDAGVTRAMMQRMSALVVQASGVRREGAGTRDRTAVARVEAGGRETLEELREVLGSLHPPIAQPTDRAAGHTTGHSTDSTDSTDSTSLSERRRAHLDWVDALAGCSGIPVAVECVVSSVSRGPAIANIVAGVALGVPLVWRRRYALLSGIAFLALAVLMASLLTPLTGTVTILLPLSLSAYALGGHTRGAGRVAGLVVLVGGGLTVSLANPDAHTSDGLVPSLVWLGLAFGAGVLAAQHSDRAVRLSALLARVEAGREDAVRLAVAEQRQTMAGELHDTVAHAMTVVCLHAEAAQQQWSDDRAVEDSLRIIESAAREAMGHLRAGLGALETEVDHAESAAGEVQNFARSLGVTVAVSADTEMSPTERTLARRVVREALVNVARHAAGATARVLIAREDGGLVVGVSNAASTGQVFTSGSQRGLTGLGELFAAHGGSVEHGPTPDGGYGVTAYLPTNRSPVPA